MSNNDSPCQDLVSFKKMVIGIIGLQGVFVIASLSICVNIMSNQGSTSEKLAQVATRQEMVEQKADLAAIDASKALAVSGKAESNIAWIREGLTELKIAVRSGRIHASGE